LEPFDFYDAAGFHPHWSVESCARAYFICGGIPYYLKAFDPGLSVNQNIIRNFLQPEGPLYREPDFLLREELREVGAYSTIIEALAEGKTANMEAAKFAGLAPSQLPYFLNNLIQLGYIQRRLPLIPGKPSRKQTRYIISDPFLRFWCRFIAPNHSRVLRGSPELVFESLLKPELESFAGACLEHLCREALPWLYLSEGVTGPFQVGEFWSPTTQIDVVGLRSDGWIDLGECKWGKSDGLESLLKELSGKAAHYPLSGATLQKRLFTRLPLKARPPAGVLIHDLESLYRKGKGQGLDG
jgi:AAA+ ATPase superfamily predicted ATPase